MAADMIGADDDRPEQDALAGLPAPAGYVTGNRAWLLLESHHRALTRASVDVTPEVREYLALRLDAVVAYYAELFEEDPSEVRAKLDALT